MLVVCATVVPRAMRVCSSKATGLKNEPPGVFGTTTQRHRTVAA